MKAVAFIKSAGEPEFLLGPSCSLPLRDDGRALPARPVELTAARSLRQTPVRADTAVGFIGNLVAIVDLDMMSLPRSENDKASPWDRSKTWVLPHFR
jgi:hypothetical protein